MKKLVFLIMILACISCTEAFADYSFSFMSSDGSYGVQGTLLTSSNGNGPLLPLGGTVIGDGAANNGITYSLVQAVPSGSIRPFGATDLIFDNKLTPGSTSFLTGDGLVFKSQNGLSYVNIWGNGGTSYTLFQLGYNTSTQKEIYGPGVNGTANLTATPIPAAAWLLGTGLIGLVGIRRKIRN